MDLEKRTKDVIQQYMDFVKDLRQAIKSNDTELVRNLANGDLRKFVLDNDDIISFACRQERYDALRELFDAGVNVDRETSAIGDVPKSMLFSAVELGNTKLVEVLIEKGADVNRFYGRDSMTPLMKASFDGKLEIIRILVDGKADMNIFAPSRELNLSDPEKEIMQTLTEAQQSALKKAVSDGVVIHGRNTLMVAAVGRDPIPSVKLLLELGADPYARNDGGEALMDYLSKRRDGGDMISFVQAWIDQKALDGMAGLQGDFSHLSF